jgi:hypothetical protein
LKSPLNGSIQLSVMGLPFVSLPHFSVMTMVSTGTSICASERLSAPQMAM